MDVSCLYRDGGLMGRLSRGWDSSVDSFGSRVVHVVRGVELHFYVNRVDCTEDVLEFVQRVRLAIVGALDAGKSSADIGKVTLDEGLFHYLLMPRLNDVLEKLGIVATRHKSHYTFSWDADAPCTAPCFRPIPVVSVPVEDMSPFAAFEAQDASLDGTVGFRGGELRVHASLLKEHGVPPEGITKDFSEDAVWLFLAYLYTNDLSLVYISLDGVRRIEELIDLATIFDKSDLRSVCINFIGKERITADNWRRYVGRFPGVPCLTEYIAALGRRDPAGFVSTNNPEDGGG